MGTNLTFYYKDENHIRVELNPKSYILLLNDTLYLIANHNGQKTVMDMSKLMPENPSNISPIETPAEKALWNDISIEPTREKETVANIEGDLYKMTATMRGEQKELEVVTSHATEAIMLQNAYKSYVEKLVQISPYSPGNADVLKLFNYIEAQQLGGLIRIDDNLSIQSVKEKKFKDTFFSLPDDYIDLYELQQSMQNR
jgi:type II secretory pathway component GspD/PulD (secretin)